MTRGKVSNQLSEVQAEWYERLRAEGFEDIEDVSDPDRPLHDWDSIRFQKDEIRAQVEKRTPYQQKIDSFANDPQFAEILKLVVKHGNSKFQVRSIEYIWTMHRNGVTERGIAGEMKCSQTCIHFLLKRIRAWMNLIV